MNAVDPEEALTVLRGGAPSKPRRPAMSEKAARQLCESHGLYGANDAELAGVAAIHDPTERLKRINQLLRRKRLMKTGESRPDVVPDDIVELLEETRMVGHDNRTTYG